MDISAIITSLVEGTLVSWEGSGQEDPRGYPEAILSEIVSSLSSEDEHATLVRALFDRGNTLVSELNSIAAGFPSNLEWDIRRRTYQLLAAFPDQRLGKVVVSVFNSALALPPTHIDDTRLAIAVLASHSYDSGLTSEWEKLLESPRFAAQGYRSLVGLGVPARNLASHLLSLHRRVQDDRSHRDHANKWDIDFELLLEISPPATQEMVTRALQTDVRAFSKGEAARRWKRRDAEPIFASPYGDDTPWGGQFNIDSPYPPVDSPLVGYDRPTAALNKPTINLPDSMELVADPTEALVPRQLLHGSSRYKWFISHYHDGEIRFQIRSR